MRDVEQTAQEIAASDLVDGYALWRAMKEIEQSIYRFARTRSPLPIELLRARRIIQRSRELRSMGRREATCCDGEANRGSGREQPEPEACEIIDRYRSLGGRRLAVAVDDHVMTTAGEFDTAEASSFWAQVWSSADASRRRSLINALINRGR